MNNKVSAVSINAAGLGHISIHWDKPVSYSHANEAIACTVSPEAYRRALYEPTPERVERVARAIAVSLAEQDGNLFSPPADWDMQWSYIDQNQADFAQIARAAIAAMGVRHEPERPSYSQKSTHYPRR